jgi:hypothetical protein
MADRDSTFNELQDYLERHFPDGEPNAPYWRQTPYCNDLFRIYRAASQCGLTDEDLLAFIRGSWNATLQSRPTSDRAKQIEELCLTLSAWSLYDQCASRE